MISSETYSRLVNYWQKENVVCHKASLGGRLLGTQLAEVWELIGMPRQDWWLFGFVVPSGPVDGPEVSFGTVGDLKLYYRILDNTCLFGDDDGLEYFANSSFVAFMETLVLFHEGCRRIQRECPGDSGEDWDRGDVIIEQMEVSMRSVDARAFENSSNLWPYLLVDING